MAQDTLSSEFDQLEGEEFDLSSLEEEDQHTSILYYGEGGTGKTTNCASMANLGRVLYINAESGLRKRRLRDLGIATQNIVPYPKTGQDLDFDHLERWFWKLRSDLDRDPDSWAGVVFDSMTEITRSLLEAIITYQYQRSVELGKARLRDTKPEDIVNRYFADQGDYGIMGEQIRQLVRQFRDLPCHFAMTALQRREEDKEDLTVVYQPAVIPSLQNDLIGIVDMVCHTDARIIGGVDEYHGRFRPHGKFRGKDRDGVFPTKGIVYPTFERVLAYVDGEMQPDTDPLMEEAKARRQKSKEEE